MAAELTNEGELHWFGGNHEALEMFRMLVRISHTWDDLIDKDREVSDDTIDQAFLMCLVYLPANRFYQSIQQAVLPMWLTVVSAYQTANKFERDKDPHGIEIAHSLRYAAGHIVAYAIIACVGQEKAKEYLPDMWKTVFFERFDDYRKEHLDADPK